MGEIRRYFCKCGYQKDLFTGGGLGGCNIGMIANFFPKEAETFLKERNEGRVKRYIMENEISYCSHCQEILALPAFSYTRKDGYTCHFESKCPACQGAVSRAGDEENLTCPKCGSRMQYVAVGDWD